MELKPRCAVVLMMGGAIALVMLERARLARAPGSATPIFVPTTLDTGGPALPPGASPVAVSAPVLLQGSSVSLSPGQRYRVSLLTHGAASALASESRVISEAQNRGLSGVTASKTKPAGWPGAANGDYYLTGVYQGSPRSQPRTEGNFLGSVDAVEVWVG